MRKKDIRKYQGIALKALAGKIDDFYLAGGTALSLFYFQKISFFLFLSYNSFSKKTIISYKVCSHIRLSKDLYAMLLVIIFHLYNLHYHCLENCVELPKLARWVVPKLVCEVSDVSDFA